ncbi:hypothetical protein, partial [Mesorhizobium sp. GbtcB19]|uniref:hypothetical protein n=1 Tax=Mesorhizobium sp. GbtcB19 TaxID=2824764 RepID=UPI001C305127
TKGTLRSELLRRQRRTALVRGAYIVATRSSCQQPTSLFFRFLVEISATTKMVSWLGSIPADISLPAISAIAAKAVPPSGCVQPPEIARSA